MRTQGGVRFEANVHAAAKDASPATALVAQNTPVPAWAANMFRMPVLDAAAALRVARSSFEVRSLLAHGARTSVRAEHTKRDGQQDGPFSSTSAGSTSGTNSPRAQRAGCCADGWLDCAVATLRDVAASADALGP